MTLRDIVKELRDRGHSVVYKKRSDGSIAVLSIDSERFTAGSRAGNRRARELAGETLSRRITEQRRTAGRKGGISRGAQRTAQASERAKAPKRPKTKAQIQEEREYRHLRRIAKKHGLKPIGKRQINKAKKRGKTWAEIRQDIIRTYKARYTKIADPNTIQGVAIYIRDHHLSSEIPAILEDPTKHFMGYDIQELKEAAYDAVENGTPFNESYWKDRLTNSASEAESGLNDARAFERELRRKV